MEGGVELFLDAVWCIFKDKWVEGCMNQNFGADRSITIRWGAFGLLCSGGQEDC